CRKTGFHLSGSCCELKTTKKPRTIVGGASVELMRFSRRLRAHASPGPEGRGGFGRAFGGREHGGDLCGRVLRPSTAFRRDCGRRTPTLFCPGARRLEDDFLEVVAADDDDREVEPSAFAHQTAADGR